MTGTVYRRIIFLLLVFCIIYHMPSFWIIWRWSFGQFIWTLLDQYSPTSIKKVYDPHITSWYGDSLSAACSCDIVFLAVPIRVFEETLIACKPFFQKDTLIIEVCTVKTYPIQCMQNHISEYSYIATHPMFGPYSYAKQWSLKDLRLVICDKTVNQKDYEKFIAITKLLQLRIIECDAQEHDKMLAKSLFLTHYITQIVVEAWLENTEIDTLSFWNLMDVVDSVRNDTKLFHDVWEFNPYCKELISLFTDAKEKVDISLL